MSDAPLLRFGILGAARIAPNALIKPARAVPGVQVTAVAARDATKASNFAERYNIPRVDASYEALVNDPELDAIYNPLPNSMHCEWTVKALRAGKHVLCEKPLASNAQQAEWMAQTADESGKVLMEAFHYRYHPLALRLGEIIKRGEIGAVREIRAFMCFPLPRVNDIRFRYELGGGATMDAGCYCINLIRYIVGAEPSAVMAEAKTLRPQVDRRMHAEFVFANGARAEMTCSMLGLPLLRLQAIIRGKYGTIRVTNPFVPQFFHSLHVTTASGTRREQISREPTYNFQLRAFVEAVHGKPTNITDGAEGVKNMRMIDSVYTASGLDLRGL